MIHPPYTRLFAYGADPENVKVVSPSVALPLFDEVLDTEKSFETTVNFEPIYKMAKQHIFKDNTVVPVEMGRRKEALQKLKILSEKNPNAEDYCKDLEKAIKKLDALPTGLLKDIADIKLNGTDLDVAYSELQKLVPQKYLINIFKTADLANDTDKLVVLSEEFI